MSNVFDLKTVVTQLSSGVTGAQSIGGRVPTGKTRFLTYLKIERISRIPGTTATVLTGVVASVAESAPGITTSEISAVRLFGFTLPGMSSGSGASGLGHCDAFAEVEIPKTPNMDHPVAKVEGGASSFMVFALSSGPSARVMAQYYDE